jgi:hypothetical protein
MEKAKYYQICNLKCKGNSPQRRGTGQCIKLEQIKITAITELKINKLKVTMETNNDIVV